MEDNDPRANLDRLIREQGDDYASLSRMLGKNAAYIQQFIKRGTPRKLDEEDRQRLADYFGVDQRLLGGPASAAALPVAKSAARDGLVRIRQLQIGASAGPGALAEDDSGGGTMAFAPAWLKRLGVDAGKLSVISVDGDSMDPTLCHGDDIMVDHSAIERPLRDGIYVLRMNDVLLVKRLALLPGGRLAIRSDNTQYPDWDDVDPEEVTLIGRVVWTGRQL